MMLLEKSPKCCKAWKPKLVFLAIFFVMFTLFFCSIFVGDQYTKINGIWDGSTIMLVSACKKPNSRRLSTSRGAETLPRGIVHRTSDLELRPLWNSPRNELTSKSLLAIAAGIQQMDDVDKIVQKFPASNFTIMLFHYDGIVDEWRRLPWTSSAIHIAAFNQTKWWFAKRFLQPDVVSEYDFVFVWDEDLNVDHFHANRYLDIVKEEGLEISQPALDPYLSSEVHHRITIRHKKTKVHRRIVRVRGNENCFENSTQPPCTAWVEMMAPVFSRAAWICVWHLIQNDLPHAWGMDMKLGYCAQGDPTKKVGVVDSEYLIHRGIPSLGGGIVPTNKTSHSADNVASPGVDARLEVRKRAHIEMDMFKARWNAAVEEDKCWQDPYADA